MEFFKQNTKIDFMGLRKWAAVFSFILFAISITSLFINGLKFGLDFTGGIQIEMTYSHEANIPQIRQTLHQAGFDQAIVQTYGNVNDVLVSLGFPKNINSGDTKAADAIQQQLRDRIENLLPGASIQRVDFVGPQLGKELATRGALALVIAMIGTMIYILLRYEYRFAVSSAIALIHDPVLILGIFSLFHIEFDVNALGALLAVIGYSLNDTVVVFDRVRENFRKVRKLAPVDIMNLSINQTLSRTIMTSGLTLVAVVVLYFFGGAMLASLALAMIIGVVVGTYSSIYVAGALALAMGLNRNDLMPTPKTELDERP
ncbi:MAG: protein translocase subunit SecF [Legionellales bacterium]|nr:protein translocase subunit SecF [Legionellales bacterium]